MESKTAFFLPTRKGSLRVANKNTRPFAGFQGGLLENKLNQLLKTKLYDEIILSTNDELSIEIAENYTRNDDRLKVISRPDSLCLDTTDLKDLITYVPTITDADYIAWGHVTTPLADELVYDAALNKYFNALEEGYDSLVSVTEFKNFLLNEEGVVINNSTNLRWPRTQDLEALFEINHVLFLADRNSYVFDRNRVGSRPFLYCMDKISSVDVDWEDDFKIAEVLYERYKRL